MENRRLMKDSRLKTQDFNGLIGSWAHGFISLLAYKPIGLLLVSCVLYLVSSSLLLAPAVFADQRSYAWTYEYKTVGRGDAELESYFTLSTPDIEEFEGNTSAEHRLELEVGMTDHFDFAIYQIFEQPADGNFRYKRYQLRSRYRIGEKGQLPVDPLVYVEYKGKPDFSEHGIEFKLILAKDIGRFNIALNPIFELEREKEWEFETEYAVGISYEINNLLRAGLEAKGSEHGQYVGPVISHGREDLWVALGSAFKIGEVESGRPEFQIRMLLGVGFDKSR